MAQPVHELPPPTVVRRLHIGDRALEAFVQAVVEWTRRQHPERLEEPDRLRDTDQ